MSSYLKNVSTFVLIFISVVALQAQTKTTSLLWGENGELWDSRGRLSDFSYAGYGGGYAIKPEFTNIIDVTQEGVIPNDGLSDVAQIATIIRNAPNNSVIYFPAGQYTIDQILEIRRSNIVLRGEGTGPNQTEFYMPNSSKDINADDKTSDQFIKFRGEKSGGTTDITEVALRTDKVIVVQDASTIRRGDMIEIRSGNDNPINGELWHQLFYNQAPDWPEPHVTWATGKNVAITHTVEKVEGNLLTLREPLRIKLKPSWNLKVSKKLRSLKNVGIENIRIVCKKVPKEPHLQEPGYNPIWFNHCDNFWLKDLILYNVDNGIQLRDVAYGEMTNIEFRGREGHNGAVIAYSSSVLATNIHYNNEKPFLHSFTFIHKANGNVVRNVTADNSQYDNVISKDFHRNAPFSNLWTDVRSPSNHQSSGDPKSGPRAGAHNVYWGIAGKSTGLYSGNPSNWKQRWGEYRNTIVSEMDLDAGRSSELLTEDREWYEHIPNLAKRDLYELQLAYKQNYTPELEFNSNEYGNREDWKERDASRWKVKDDNGTKKYTLVVDSLPVITGNRLSEYSLVEVSPLASYEVEAKMKVISARTNRDESDMAVVISYIDDQNYVFGRISTDAQNTGIYSVNNGTATKLASSAFTVGTDNDITLKMVVNGSDVELRANDQLVTSASNVQNLPFGKVGFGASNNGLKLEYFNTNSTLLSVDEVQGSIKTISVFPNPSQNGRFQLSKETSWTVFDITGQRILSGDSQKINLSYQSAGIYFLNLQGNVIKLVKL